MTQDVLLRKENDSLNSLIGKSFNQKNKFEAEKILNEIHLKAESRMIGKKALCYVLDQNEIKGVGGSTLMRDKNGKIISNLILDQMGILLSRIFLGKPQGSTNANMKDENGVTRTTRVFLAGATFITFIAGVGNEMGAVLQIGSGTTPPLRTDFDIDNPFSVSPESDNNNASDPVYDSNTGSFKSSIAIQAGGTGTINESALKNTWNSLATPQVFTAFRDIISPAQSFIAGQTIVLEYTIQL